VVPFSSSLLLKDTSRIGRGGFSVSRRRDAAAAIRHVIT